MTTLVDKPQRTGGDVVPAPFGVTADLMPVSPLMAISPLDGRYGGQVADLRQYFSEFALIRFRVRVEIEWLIFVLRRLDLPGAPAIGDSEERTLRGLLESFDVDEAERVKRHERVTRHDVKAVEYYLREKLTQAGLGHFGPFVHLCCTSEDINNVSHALMLRDGLAQVWLPAFDSMQQSLRRIADAGIDAPMLSRTHGQAASPTTLGKEMAVFHARLTRQREVFLRHTYRAKFGGAVGNYNAHVSAYPDVDWRAATKSFIESFGLEENPTTTQIEPHDYMAELFHNIIRVNSILIDLNRDVWSYISFGYLKQRLYAGEVGSSTMPHKINPIDFENSEANAGIATALLDHLSLKLPISRMQRDLSDSAALRTMGVGIGHAVLALKACIAGLDKVDMDAGRMLADLDGNWAVLAEAIQTVLRKYGVEDAYEQIKLATQNRDMDAAAIRQIVEAAAIDDADRQRLLSLTPAGFVGLAREIASDALGAAPGR